MQLVREHINFERNYDPKDAMQIGDLKTRVKNAIIKMLQEDWNLINEGNLTYIESLVPQKNFLKMHFLEERLKNKNGKQVNRLKHANRLIGNSKINYMFSKSEAVLGYHDIYTIYFHIQEEFTPYFDFDVKKFYMKDYFEKWQK